MSGQVQNKQRVVEPGESADAELVRRFQRGDELAFDEIVAGHEAFVSRLVYRLLGWCGDVDDVVQDVFIAAWKGLHKFRNDSGLRTWISRITVNTCRSYQRKQMLKMRIIGLFDRSELKVAKPADDRPLEQERDLALHRAVGELPMKFREVIVLRYLQEFEIAEIVNILGVSRAVIDTRLSRARQALAESLAHWAE